MYLQAQLENEYLNAAVDESDDGLILGESVPVGVEINDINRMMMMMEDPGYPPLLPSNLGWIQWFLNLEDHEFFVEVDKEFIEDKMNLLKLNQNFSSKQRYKDCLKLMLSNKIPNEEDLQK